MAAAEILLGQVPVHCRAVAVAVLGGSGRSARVLLVRRGEGRLVGEWSLITGRMETGERAWQAAVREVREEAGLNLDALFSSGFCEHFYDPAQESIEVVPVFVGIVAADAMPTLNQENTDWQWAEVFDAAELVPFHGHRVALGVVAREFLSRPPAEWRRIGLAQP